MKLYKLIILYVFCVIFSVTTVTAKEATKASNLKNFDLSLSVELENGKTEVLLNLVKKLPKDKPILLYLWASWCPDCLVEAPFLDAYLKEKSSLVTMLYFSVDEKRASWLKKKKDTPHGGISVRFAKGWKDKDFRKSIQLDWIPRYILINQKGEVLHSYAIKIEDSKLRKAIEEYK